MATTTALSPAMIAILSDLAPRELPVKYASSRATLAALAKRGLIGLGAPHRIDGSQGWLITPNGRQALAQQA